MTLLEVVIYGPFFCVVFAGVGSLLLQITEGIEGRPWLGKTALALAFVVATGATWAVGSMAGLNEPVGYRDYMEPPPIDYGRFTR